MSSLTRSHKLIKRRRAARTARAFSPRALGPGESGVASSAAQYARCIDAPGYRSEIIDGVVHVSPSPRRFHQAWSLDIAVALREFARRSPNVINHVATDNDVVIQHRPGPTRPRPDVTAYHNFPPRSQWLMNDDWTGVCPILVVEVLSKTRSRKDIERNRILYWAAGGIAEYWIVDPQLSPLKPKLTVLVRGMGRHEWTEHAVPFGRTWKSSMISGLSVSLSDIAKQAGE
ncbi:MAG: Uma2 family endonuclease [Phycisphaerae bacterium]